MKFVSWNVNGLRACMKKGFADFFHEADADVFAIQETKMQENQLEDAMNYAARFGLVPETDVVLRKPF